MVHNPVIRRPPEQAQLKIPSPLPPPSPLLPLTPPVSRQLSLDRPDLEGLRQQMELSVNGPLTITHLCHLKAGEVRTGGRNRWFAVRIYQRNVQGAVDFAHSCMSLRSAGRRCKSFAKSQTDLCSTVVPEADCPLTCDIIPLLLSDPNKKGTRFNEWG